MRTLLAVTMAEEQAPTEHNHNQRLNESNIKRKRLSEAQPEDEDGTQPSSKRQLRHIESNDSVEEKNMKEAQQNLLSEGGNGEKKKSRKRVNRHISEQALRDMLQRALDTGSLAGQVSVCEEALLYHIPFDGRFANYISASILQLVMKVTPSLSILSISRSTTYFLLSLAIHLYRDRDG